MSRRRRTLLLVIAGALVLATVGSGAFSSVSADRSVSVAAVDDDAAYLSVERNITTLDGNETLQVTVSNRFPSVDELTVTVDVGDESKTRTVTESHAFEFPADCDASVHVTADGPGTYVELTRPVPCDAAGDAGDDVDEGDDADADDAAGEDAGDDTDDRDGDTEGDSDSDVDGTADEDDDTEGEEDDTDGDDDDTDGEESDTETGESDFDW